MWKNDLERKKLQAWTLEECRDLAARDSECSDTMYHCEDEEGLWCGCVMSGKSCIKDDTTVNDFGYNCTVEVRKEVDSGEIK